MTMSHTMSREEADTIVRTALRGFASDAELVPHQATFALLMI